MPDNLSVFAQVTRGLMVSRRPLQLLCQRIVDVLKAQSVKVYLLDSGSQTLHLFAQAGEVVELVGQIDTSHVPNANTDAEIVEVEIVDIIDDPMGQLRITFPNAERAQDIDYNLLEVLSQFAGEVALVELAEESESKEPVVEEAPAAALPAPSIVSELLADIHKHATIDALSTFISDSLSSVFDVSYFSIALIQSGSSQLELKTLVGGDERLQIPLQGGVFQQALAEDKPIRLAGLEVISEKHSWLPISDGVVYVLPMSGRSELIGTLNVGLPSSLPDDSRLLQQVARLMALSLENLRLMDRLEESIGEANLLYNFSLSANTATNLQEVYALTLEELGATSQADNVRLFIAGPNPRTELSFVEEVGRWSNNTLQQSTDITRYDLAKAPIISQFAQSRSNLMFNELANAEQIDRELRQGFLRRGVSSLMLVPLSTGAVWLGAALLEGSYPFTSEQSQITRSVADQAAIAIDTQMLIARTRGSAVREQALREVTVRIRNAETVEQVMQIAAEHMSGILDMSPDAVEYVSAHTSQRHRLDPEQRELIETVSSQVSLAVENLNLLESTQKTAFRERIVNGVTSRIQRSTTTDKVLEETVRALQDVFTDYDISLHLTQDAIPTNDREAT